MAHMWPLCGNWKCIGSAISHIGTFIMPWECGFPFGEHYILFPQFNTTNHALFHSTFHYIGKPKVEWGILSGMWQWNKSCCPQVECSSGMCHKFLVIYIILYNSKKNCKLIRCNHYKMECAMCHKFFEQVSLMELMSPFFS